MALDTDDGISHRKRVELRNDELATDSPARPEAGA